MSQQYCLRWNNHQHNLLSVFEDLLHHEAFVDVTLACDGLQLKAHKMVLSACSPYFQSMLYGTPDRHPIVFLRDVRYHEMKALLEFMYRGEVSVDQDNLTSLLKVAEGLKIKGLADVNEQKQQQQAQAAMAGLLTLQQSPAHPLFPGMMSPSNTNSKRPASPNPPPNPNSSQQQNPNYLGPKRKRGRPRRLSGSEAVPLASGLVDNTTNDELHVQTEDMNTKVKEEKGSMRDGSGDVSPKDTKTSDLMSEADSNDGLASGAHSPRALDLSPPGGGANRGPGGTNRLHNPLNPIITHSSGSAGCSPPRMSTTPISAISHHNTNPDNHEGICLVTTGSLTITTSADTTTDDEASKPNPDTDIVPDDANLDYIMNEDGTCLCKLCGEKVASRTHWYRHKYKVHNVALFRCEKCEIFFKSKKGYEGHLANKHAPKILGTDGKPKTKKDVEGLNKVLKEIQTKKELEMVQRIIAEVKAECEATGGDSQRRGYTKH